MHETPGSHQTSDFAISRIDRRTHSATPLDVLFILSSAVTLLLLLLWILPGGETKYGQAPPFLKTIVESLWAKVTLAGSSVVAIVLRRFLSSHPRPNYLIWIPAFMGILIVGLFALTALGRAMNIGSVAFSEEFTYEGPIRASTTGPNDYRYGFTPAKEYLELSGAKIAGKRITVTKIVIEAYGENHAGKINWDFDVFVGPTQLFPYAKDQPPTENPQTMLDDKQSPTKIAVVFGKIDNYSTRSYQYRAVFGFVPSSLDVYPIPFTVKQAFNQPIAVQDKLFVQGAVWTGDSKVNVDVRNIKIRIEGKIES